MPQKKLLKFPCDFPIKVFGKSSLEFEAIVAALIRKHFPAIGEAAMTTNYSKNGQYVALTATVKAENQKQLDELYHDLSKCELVIMSL